MVLNSAIASFDSMYTLRVTVTVFIFEVLCFSISKVDSPFAYKSAKKSTAEKRS